MDLERYIGFSIKLVSALHWFQHRIGFNIALVSALHRFQRYIGFGIALVSALHWFQRMELSSLKAWGITLLWVIVLTGVAGIGKQLLIFIMITFISCYSYFASRFEDSIKNSTLYKLIATWNIAYTVFNKQPVCK